jgi:HD-like signal output (HDOD) protein/ActR/RegA family two-component response regulator
MSLPRILFVDDEANILDGLRNLLRKHRRVWDIVFALGGQAALAEMERAPVDVVVTDMRMPGMDGAALLKKVKADYPTVARIVLSGHADREAVLRMLPVAHQFLSKPCDGESLRIVLERTCALRAILNDEALRKIVGTLDTLPSTPGTYLELTETVAKPDAGCVELARIVERDPAMAAKTLQLVNSAYFGLGREISSIQEALVYLGIELLQGLVLTAHVFATTEAQRVDGFSLDGLQKRSLLAARLAKRLVSDPRRGDEAFTAAIIHDIGKIVMAIGMPARFAELARVARESQRPFHDVERELLGVTHAEVGAYLLGMWGLPFAIVEAVAYHHRPSCVVAGARDVLGAVHVAAALAEIATSDEHDPIAERLLDLGFVESLGWNVELSQLRAMADEEMRAPGVDHS